MKKLSDFIKWYLYITISILLVVAIIFEFYYEDTIPADTLWQILISGFLTTAATVFIAFRECNRKSTSILKYLLHYVVLCIIMITLGNCFGWLTSGFSAIMMAAAVATVYLLAFGIYYLIDLKQAKEISHKLKEMYGDEE